MVISHKDHVLLFIGGNIEQKTLFFNQFIGSLSKDLSEAPEVKTFYADSLEPKDFFDHLNSRSLFISVRVILLKYPDRASSDFMDSLALYMKNPSQNAYLIIDAKDEISAEPFLKLRSCVKVYSFPVPRGADFIAWIKSACASRGKKIDEASVAILKEFEGSDLSYLSNEMDKLSSYVGGRPNITARDVGAVIGRSLSVSAFDIIEAISLKDSAAAISVISDLLLSGKKEYEILGLVLWGLKRMLKAKAMKLKGYDDHSISRELKLGLSKDIFLRRVESLSMNDIRFKIRQILAADIEIKRARLKPGLALETLLLKLCG